MRRITLSAVLVLSGTINMIAGQDYKEFKRMPDFRGQSFGLENFLMQPFNIGSQEEPPNRRQPSYSLEYQVQNDDYDVKKLMPTGPRAPLGFNQERPTDDFKPVHEIPEPLPRPPRRRQPTGEAFATMFENPTPRRVPPPETRRPLERPAEFMLNSGENDPYPQPLEEVRPERHRKRVMKRRRKKPSTPQPDEEKIPMQEETIQETLANIFGDEPESPLPTSYQQSSITIPDTAPQRRKPVIHRRKPFEDNNEDRLQSEASQIVPEKIDSQEITTESDGESTQKLKSLLKQQNGQLSLSELLQTQNLSLSDFLKGNPGALSALGAHKATTEKELPTQTEPISERPKPEPHRPHIPKISSKSRPFSKTFNVTKISRRPTTTTTEENVPELPKKLQIIEVTSDRPAYNGFAPKHPRIRGGLRHETKFNFSKLAEDPVEKEQDIAESVKDEELIPSTTKGPVSKQTTHSLMRESTITEHKLGSKRYGEYRLKSRRKPSTEASTEASTVTDETTIKTSAATEEMKIPKEAKNRVRIPFMSVNNPEISLILPNKRFEAVTEKTKDRTIPIIKERVNLFKRVNTEEKPSVENTLETTEPTTSTEPLTTKTETTTEQIYGKETSDEIVELLKTGNNAQRLERILAERNMTVDELLEKRANSSKQPNVTRLFESHEAKLLANKEKIVELSTNEHPSTERAKPQTTKKIPPVFPDLPSWKANKVEAKKSNSFDELFVDESMIRPIKLPFDKEANREPKAVEKKEKVNLNLPPVVLGKAGTSIPLWNVNDRAIYNSNPYPSYDLNKNLAGQTTTTESTTVTEGALILETINKNPETNNRLKSSINEILKEQGEIVKDLKEEKTFIPPAVKSAIIASGVVMGIALIVFVAIFAACGWKQRQFRLRARSSILNDSLNGSAHKAIRRTGTLSPVSFKRSSLYKKSIDFEDSGSSISGSSNTSSYLWNTLKHTFQSRNSTLKNRQEKEEKIQERENRSRKNTLSREDERPRRNTLSRDEQRRDSVMNVDIPRRNTLGRDDFRRDSILSRDTLARDHTRDSIISRDQARQLTREDSRRNSCFRDDNRRLSSLLRENERCSFKKIDPERNIIQTSVNFKRGGFNGSSRHFDSCDHFN